MASAQRSIKSSMYKLIAIVLLSGGFTPHLWAQDYVNQEHVKAMSALTNMAGSWEGGGWFMTRSGEKETFTQTEEIKFQLGGTILLIEGIGRDSNDAEKLVHHAMAIISYDPQKKQYAMKSYLADGRSTSASMTIDAPGKITWWFEDGHGGTIRYKINLSEKDWQEIGEYSRDGENWQQFIEMNLQKTG